MAKFCSNCGKELKEGADVCLECGTAINLTNKNSTNKNKKIPTWLIVIIVILGIGVIGVGLKDEEQNNINNNVQNDNTANNDNETNNNNSNTNNKKEKFSYEITSSEPDNINFGYYIEGIVTNNTNKEYNYVQIEFVCYDSDGNNLGTAMDNVNNLGANEKWKFKAMGLFTNQTVDHCDYKEITSW